MKAQLVLTLCLLAIVACAVFAEEAEVQAHGHTHVRKVGKDKNGNHPPGSGYYGDYKDDYDSRPYPHKHIECDEPKTWPSDWKSLACIDAESGDFVKICTNNTNEICLTVGDDGFCKFTFRTGPCRKAKGNCDIEEVCTGTNATCPSDKLLNGTVCTPDPVKSYGNYPYPTSGECIITYNPPKCDGKSVKCIGSRPADIGTPCGEDGLYSEAYTEDGKLATVASYPAEHAEKHGYKKCKRCYNGHCRTFKWEWWKTVKEHHGKHEGPKREYYSYDDKPYKPYGDEPEDDYPKYYDDDGDYYKKGHKSHKGHKDYKEDDEPEYEEEYAKIEVYPTKVELADYDGYDGYEPEFYCLRNP